MARRKLPEVELSLLEEMNKTAAKQIMTGSLSALRSAWQMGYEACHGDYRRGQLRPDANPFLSPRAYDNAEEHLKIQRTIEMNPLQEEWVKREMQKGVQTQT
jgi:hypothetical protein